MARAFSRPIETDAARRVKELSGGFMQAQRVLEAKRKQTRILRSRSVPNQAIAFGDLVEVHIRTSINKRRT